MCVCLRVERRQGKRPDEKRRGEMKMYKKNSQLDTHTLTHTLAYSHMLHDFGCFSSLKWTFGLVLSSVRESKVIVRWTLARSRLSAADPHRHRRHRENKHIKSWWNRCSSLLTSVTREWNVSMERWSALDIFSLSLSCWAEHYFSLCCFVITHVLACLCVCVS